MELDREGDRSRDVDVVKPPGRDDHARLRTYVDDAVKFVLEDELERAGVHGEPGPDPIGDAVRGRRPAGWWSWSKVSVVRTCSSPSGSSVLTSASLRLMLVRDAHHVTLSAWA